MTESDPRVPMLRVVAVLQKEIADGTASPGAAADLRRFRRFAQDYYGDELDAFRAEVAQRLLDRRHSEKQDPPRPSGRGDMTPSGTWPGLSSITNREDV